MDPQSPVRSGGKKKYVEKKIEIGKFALEIENETENAQRSSSNHRPRGYGLYDELDCNFRRKVRENEDLSSCKRISTTQQQDQRLVYWWVGRHLSLSSSVSKPKWETKKQEIHTNHRQKETDTMQLVHLPYLCCLMNVCETV